MLSECISSWIRIIQYAVYSHSMTLTFQKPPHRFSKQLVNPKRNMPSVIPKILRNRQTAIRRIVCRDIRCIIAWTVVCCILDPVLNWIIKDTREEAVRVKHRAFGFWMSRRELGRRRCDERVVCVHHSAVRERCYAFYIPRLVSLVRMMNGKEGWYCSFQRR